MRVAMFLIGLAFAITPGLLFLMDTGWSSDDDADFDEIELEFDLWRAENGPSRDGMMRTMAIGGILLICASVAMP